MDIWRIVFDENNSVTLQEIETSWTIDDLDRALAVMDYNNMVMQIINKYPKGK